MDSIGAVKGQPICTACGLDGLRPHRRVRGSVGADGFVPTTDRFGSALADIVRCPRCGHMQTEPMPSDELLNSAYAEAESGALIDEEAGQRVTARQTLELIEAHRGAPGTFLDLGCWVGFLLAEARLRGWQVTGVEPSRYASAYARAELGLNVHQAGLFDAPLPAAKFDAIALGDVIEHLPDPAAALHRIAGLLSPDGILWMAIPDAGSRLARALGARWWSVLPTHVQYFTRGSIATLLWRCGFEPLMITTSPKAFSVRYYLRRIAGYSPAAAGVLVGVAERAGVTDRMWAPDFGDRMAVVARRRS